MIKELFMKKKKFQPISVFFNEKEALDPGLRRTSRSRRSWDQSGRSRFPWPFATWGMQIISAFTPPSSAGHQYLLAATDYFSKWAEAIAVKDFKNRTVSEFIRTHIIYRFGIPDSIISDNEQPFISSPLYWLYAKYNIKQAKETTPPKMG